MFYVYAYHDPTTGIPFYVGKGSDDRYSHHADNARYYRTEDKFPRGYNRHLHYKICQIRALGLEPAIYIWHRDLLEKQALLLEKVFIKLLGRDDLGTGPLLNLTDGGEGVSGRPPWNKGIPTTPELAEQISKTLLVRYSECPVSETTRDAISESVLAWTSSEEGQNVIRARAQSQVGTSHSLASRSKQSASMKAAWAAKRAHQAEENVNG